MYVQADGVQSVQRCEGIRGNMRVEWAEVCLDKERVEKKRKKPYQGILGIEYTCEDYERM